MGGTIHRRNIPGPEEEASLRTYQGEAAKKLAAVPRKETVSMDPKLLLRD